MTQMVKNAPAMRETWVQSLGWEDPLEKGMAAKEAPDWHNSCMMQTRDLQVIQASPVIFLLCACHGESKCLRRTGYLANVTREFAGGR